MPPCRQLWTPRHSKSAGEGVGRGQVASQPPSWLQSRRPTTLACSRQTCRRSMPLGAACPSPPSGFVTQLGVHSATNAMCRNLQHAFRNHHGTVALQAIVLRPVPCGMWCRVPGLHSAL